MYSARSHDSSQNASGDESVFRSAVSQDAPMINNNNNNGDTINNRVLIGLVSKLSSIVQTLQQNVSSLTSKVNTLIAERPSLPGQARAVKPVVNSLLATSGISLICQDLQIKMYMAGRECTI